MNFISQAGHEKSIAVDMLCKAMHIPRATYYQNIERQDLPRSPVSPVNALTRQEKQNVLDLLHSESFIDKTPYDAYYKMMDNGEYHCSPRTMYRILAEHGESKNRRVQRNHRDAVKPELISTRPNEVWSWDITKLLGNQKWVYYHLYVIMDIFSRYVVGWLIADAESQELARKLIQESALKGVWSPMVRKRTLRQ